MSKTILIIGNGIAGHSAAKAARDADPTCRIVLLDAGDKNTYTRTRLPEYISGEIGLEDLFPYKDEWYEKNNIQLMQNCTIDDIDTNSCTINSNMGSMNYDSLIIASGSSCNIPPIPGVALPNVFGVRTLEDSNKIKRLSGEGKNCTIIGGGLLGLEMAWAIRQLGCNINIVEFTPRLLVRQADEKSAQLLLEAITAKGMKVHLNVSTQEICGNDYVEHVKLSNGEVIPSDFVILSTGVKANVNPFSTHIAANRGIMVNDYMETNVPNVYASGDVAEYNGKNFCIWPIAIAQGKIAGYNAAVEESKRIRYDDVQPFTNLKIKGITMFSIGDISGNEAQELWDYDPSINRYIKFYVKEDILEGAIVFGDSALPLKIKKAVEKKLRIQNTSSVEAILNSI